MSRKTNEELYVPYKKPDPEPKGYEKFAIEHGAPPLKDLLRVALITVVASLVVLLVLVITGLRLTTAETPNGDEIRYFGWVSGSAPTAGIMQWKSGLGASVGGGQVVYSDGSVYTGEMKDFMKHGMGKLIFADGTTYSGEFKNDLYDGFGEIIYPDGGSYVGYFKEGKYSTLEKDGESLSGKLVLADGTNYTGGFENGEFSGQGKLVYYDGSTFEGSFENGMRSHGKYTWRTGESIEGVFLNNMPGPEGYFKYTEGGESGNSYYVVIKDGVIVKRTSYINVEGEEEAEEETESPEEENESGAGDSEAVG